MNAFIFAAFASFDANVAMDGAALAGTQPSSMAYAVSAALTLAILLLAVASLMERSLRKRLRHSKKGAHTASLRKRTIAVELPEH